MATAALLIALSSFSPTSISEKIEDVVNRSVVSEGSLIGISVRDSSGQVLFERMSTTRLVPASNQKALTCLWALETKSAEARLTTRIWNTPSKTVIYAQGDPTITLDDVRKVAAGLPFGRNHPVEVWQAFRVGVPGTWEHDDLPNRYAPQISALTFDRSGFELRSERGSVIPLPSEYGIKVQLRAGPNPARVSYDPLSGQLWVEGSIGLEPRTLDTLALPAPDRAFAKFMGVGFTELDALPPNASKPTWERNSPPMKELIAACLQPSDNMYAEHLFLTSATGNDGKASYPQSRASLTQFLVSQVGIKASEVRPMDGSGLSRHNLVTPNALTQMLHWAKSRPTFTHFRSALARPGVGTLRSRLAGIEFNGKTGTLSGVASLSGYLKAKNGQEYTLAIMVNNFTGSSNDARGLIDEVVKTLDTAGDIGTELLIN